MLLLLLIEEGSKGTLETRNSTYILSRRVSAGSLRLATATMTCFPWWWTLGVVQWRNNELKVKIQPARNNIQYQQWNCQI